MCFFFYSISNMFVFLVKFTMLSGTDPGVVEVTSGVLFWYPIRYLPRAVKLSSINLWCRCDVQNTDTNTPTVEFVKDTEITFHFHSPSKSLNYLVSLALYLVTNIAIAGYSSPCLQTPFLIQFIDLPWIWFDIRSV